MTSKAMGTYSFSGKDLILSCGCNFVFEDDGSQEYEFCKYHSKRVMTKVNELYDNEDGIKAGIIG